jgi:hypothetical protein
MFLQEHVFQLSSSCWRLLSCGLKWKRRNVPAGTFRRAKRDPARSKILVLPESELLATKSRYVPAGTSAKETIHPRRHAAAGYKESRAGRANHGWGTEICFRRNIDCSTTLPVLQSVSRDIHIGPCAPVFLQEHSTGFAHWHLAFTAFLDCI